MLFEIYFLYVVKIAFQLESLSRSVDAGNGTKFTSINCDPLSSDQAAFLGEAHKLRSGCCHGFTMQATELRDGLIVTSKPRLKYSMRSNQAFGNDSPFCDPAVKVSPRLVLDLLGQAVLAHATHNYVKFASRPSSLGDDWLHGRHGAQRNI